MTCLYLFSHTCISDSECTTWHLRVKGLEVLEVLPERLEEEPELPELQEVRTVLVVAGGLVLGGAFSYDVRIGWVEGGPQKDDESNRGCVKSVVLINTKGGQKF